MPQSVLAGLKSEHVIRTLADLDAGLQHHFGTPTKYELVYNGKRYPPKAAVGLACRYSAGRVPTTEEISGGEAPGQANFLLRKLGFTVVRIEPNVEAERGEHQDWSLEEVRLIVADYLEMLECELLGKTYKKSAHRRALAPKLQGRSHGSIEFKHQNISGVLLELGMPYIDGYKPRSNYQGILTAEVESYLERNPRFLDKIAEAPRLNPNKGSQRAKVDLATIIEDPPEAGVRIEPDRKPWLSRKARKIDFVERDAANRRLGRSGEEFVFKLERHRLKQVGRDDLAAKIVWASRDFGDGLGFDILSFSDADDSEQMVEVKTTGLGKFFPFYVTSTEVRCSEDVPQKYQLFRVFDFGHDPRLYILHGSLRELCRLEAVVFRARV